MATTTVKPSTFLPATVTDDIIAALDTAASNKALTVASQFRRAFAVAEAVYQLKALLTPEVMKPILNLQNTSLGFQTDRREGGYPLDTVKECLIDAVLSGVSPVGNEFNIIAGRAYITKNGMLHKLSTVDGLSYTMTPGIPKMAGEGGAAIIMAIDWTFNGKTNHKDLALAVRINKGMGADAIIGKATRKAAAWLYQTVTGQTVDEGDANESAPVIEAKVSAIDAEPVKTEPAASETGELPM
jgi:hypothetical protein